MHGDFSRDTFDASRNFRRVLMQQGRVLLDADINEQQSIVLHYLEALTVDLFGSAAGNGFEIGVLTGDPRDFAIGHGHYYVDGVLCENDSFSLLHSKQPNPYWPSSPPSASEGDLVYLAAWERHMNAVEDPSIVEVALGGPDTCSRSELVWQVRVASASDAPGDPVNHFDWLQPALRGSLKAAAAQDDDAEIDPCNVAPEAQYRGPENQLYRVEIHRSGTAKGEPFATFKWSRDNGSVVYPILDMLSGAVELAHLGRDSRSTLQPGDWVELVDDALTLRFYKPDEDVPSLLQVDIVDPLSRSVTFTQAPTVAPQLDRHPYLRRWDQGRHTGKTSTGVADGGGIAIAEATWLALEDGVRIWFDPAPNDNVHEYRHGDYWLIPARVATGDVEWPADTPLPPHGINRHHAALARASADQNALSDLRTTINAPITPKS